MVGHIAGLGYSQRMFPSGLPMVGCKLYIYATGTSTPVNTYVDYAATIAHPHPIVADASGIIPMFWVADGTYRVRLTDASGNEIFDDSGIVALGPSSGAAASTTSIDSNAVFGSGDFLWRPTTGTRTGWVRANARTIGSASSGGQERASSDVETLFTFLWTNFSDTLCPVSGGRGANAAADWAANKTITTPDMRSRAPFGLDDMGNTAAGRIVAGTPTAVSASGAETVSITVAQANLPNVSFTVSGTAATHTHSISFTSGAGSSHTHGAGSFAVGTSLTNGTLVARNLGTHSVTDDGGSQVDVIDDAFTESTVSLASGAVSGTSSAEASHTHAISGTSAASGALTLTATAASGGSGTALTPNKMPPYYLGTWFIKL